MASVLPDAAIARILDGRVRDSSSQILPSSRREMARTSIAHCGGADGSSLFAKLGTLARLADFAAFPPNHGADGPVDVFAHSPALSGPFLRSFSRAGQTLIFVWRYLRQGKRQARGLLFRASQPPAAAAAVVSIILGCRIGAETAADALFHGAFCCAAWRLSGGLGAGLGSRVGARAGPGRHAAPFLRPRAVGGQGNGGARCQAAALCFPCSCFGPAC